MEYNHRETEARWQAYWQRENTFKTDNTSPLPKFYILDMFPYPSGAGLHVGHPLGYIASDILARYKRLQGFHVLHPMGFDAYGLPAEQYAIQTGQHPAITTEKNIRRYKEQLNKIGFSFDWDREVRTCDPQYYHWTQWVFIQLFHSWYSYKENKALPCSELVKMFETQGNAEILAKREAACSPHEVFTADQWKAFSEKEQQSILMNYRLAYLSDTMVNWCPALGTVLANDEVVNGLSERGGHPVERKLMRQWSLRITAYAERLLQGLETIDWSDSLKEVQRNWIGKSMGASIHFKVDQSDLDLEIFTTRADTLFGVSFMVVCPEYKDLEALCTPEQKAEVTAYVQQAKNRTERERQADVNKVSGVFTGSYALHPFSGERLPIWVSDYVLAGYGTGAIMAVAAHDSRDYRFARHFHLEIRPVVEGGDISKEAFEAKDGKLINSDFLNGLDVKTAIRKSIEVLEAKGIGKAQINYRLRDAIFSRQRYWGEPFPIYYKDGMPYTIDESQLPLELPEVDAYLPTASGEPPLARARNWQTKEGYPYECNTMPGFAGSSAYYLRYMDPHNSSALVSKEANAYWQEVDLYMGGAEHATGHLIYARFWNKFLYDLGICVKDEPFKKLINQGMIQGRSSYVYRLNWNRYKEALVKNPEWALPGIGSSDIENGKRLVFVSKNIAGREAFTDGVHADIHLVENDILDMEGFKQWMPHLNEAEFITEDGVYHCGYEIEKMSKSMYNVQNPDEIVDLYGADTLRMYEMFLGPIEQAKPWDTQGIEGVSRFLKKYWRWSLGDTDTPVFEEGEAGAQENKILHNCIRKIQNDIEKFSFNTAVSAFMIALNELSDLKTRNRNTIETFTLLLSPFAPHITEEVWKYLGHQTSISKAAFPTFEEKYVVETAFNYPVSFNGKTRFNREFPLELSPKEIETLILQDENARKWLDGKTPKKVIVVPKRIINIVL